MGNTPSCGRRVVIIQLVHPTRKGLPQATEILAFRDWQMRRRKRWYERGGYSGLFDRRRQQPSLKRMAIKLGRRVLTLYRERRFGLNVLYVHRTLQVVHGIRLSRTWVKTTLQTAAGPIAKGARRGTSRKVGSAAVPPFYGRISMALTNPPGD
jgi:hypothetical protein